MVERINFLRKAKYALTYKRLVIYLCAWFFVCIFIFFLEFLYGSWTVSKIGRFKSDLKQLDARKEQTMALMEATKARRIEPSVKGLAEVFSSFPEWSSVMKTLSENVPPQVWLTSVASGYISEDSMSRKIEIGGRSQNNTAIAGFVDALNRSQLFKNILLSKSSKMKDGEEVGYDFVVLGEVRFKGKQWE